jgi:subtilase family serine protease
MTGRRSTTAGVCLCLLIILGVLTGTANTASGASRAPSRKHLILLLTHQSPSLARFVKAVSDPTSPQYRHYLTIEQLEHRYGASPKTRQAVRSWLRSRDLRGRFDPTGTFVDVTARPVTQRVQFPQMTTDAVGPAARARLAVPAGLRQSVTAVIDGDVRLPTSVRQTVKPAASELGIARDGLLANPMGSSARGRTGTPSGCQAGQTAGPVSSESHGYAGFTPNQYRTAYGFGPLLNQTRRRGHERLALIELGGGFKQSDLTTFTKCFGIRPPNINVIALPHRQAPTDEATLDVEVAAAAAPDVAAIDVYEAPGTTGGVLNLAAETLRLRDRRPNVESSSYGLCERSWSGAFPLLKAVNSILEFDAAAGISVLSASGDTGSSDCSSNGNSAALPILSVNFPGSSPYATSVGGLNMTLSSSNRLREEFVWNNSPIAFGAGGGGTSLLFDRPWYQTIHGSAAQRSVPDVAMLADNVPGYAIYCTAATCAQTGAVTPGWSPLGGTSAATPLLAGAVADADQIAAAHHEPPIGFLNPLLYSLGRRHDSGVLRDITKGDNDLGTLIDNSPLGCCSAHVGYDQASGLGSVSVAALARSAEQTYRRSLVANRPKPKPPPHG